MDRCALDLASVSGIAAAAVGIVLAENFDNIAVSVLDAAGALDKICTLEANLVAGVHALVLRRGLLHEVVRFDPELT